MPILLPKVSLYLLEHRSLRQMYRTSMLLRCLRAFDRSVDATGALHFCIVGPMSRKLLPVALHQLDSCKPRKTFVSCVAQALYPIGKVTQGLAFKAPVPDLAVFQPEGMHMEMLRAEAMPGSRGLTRLHLEMRLPCPVWGAVNVTGPVKAWSLAAEPPEVRVTTLHRVGLTRCGEPFRESDQSISAPIHSPCGLQKHMMPVDTRASRHTLGQDVGLVMEERAHCSDTNHCTPFQRDCCIHHAGRAAGLC